MVHENLYKSRNLAEIQLGEYLDNMVRNLLDTMTMDGQIHLVTELESGTIPYDKAVPLGLVVNELVTNSVKHAFPPEQVGVITIKLRRNDGDFTLFVGDNGIGLPKELDIESSRSFGLQLIKSLVKTQLLGKLTLHSSVGVGYTIQFSTRY